MNQNTIKPISEIIKDRRSVRTYNGEHLTETDMEALKAFLEAHSNPFQVPITYQILEAKEHGLTSPVLVGEQTYLAAKVEKVKNFEMAYGYWFEKVCLFALSRGIGTVMLASTMNRDAFEKALDVKEGEVMPLVSPVGYAADKMSVRETLMRKGIKADDRKKFETLFFHQSFEMPLTKEQAGDFYQALEMVRWAPSAVNAQPWRAVVDGNKVHFFEARTMKDNSLGDIQKVDIGIALSHFELAMEEAGKKGTFSFEAPEIKLPEKCEYMVTYTLD